MSFVMDLTRPSYAWGLFPLLPILRPHETQVGETDDIRETCQLELRLTKGARSSRKRCVVVVAVRYEKDVINPENVCGTLTLSMVALTGISSQETPSILINTHTTFLIQLFTLTPSSTQDDKAKKYSARLVEYLNFLFVRRLLFIVLVGKVSGLAPI
ncbi:hypothetical protein NPIL_360701 [Nephila pilipes]|uniref:Uncharacterized protein n=1 Tax=Nephila pilipes TaxID=299642 RepID=A0A8X6NU87_NEPPI|nr:hypothetical protein NPIL_360701 [Nephila pilipes]